MSIHISTKDQQVSGEFDKGKLLEWSLSVFPVKGQEDILRYIKESLGGIKV